MNRVQSLFYFLLYFSLVITAFTFTFPVNAQTHINSSMKDGDIDDSVSLPTASETPQSMRVDGATVSVTDALSSIAGKYSIIWGFDSTQQRYMPYSPDVPSYVNKLSIIDNGQGYWLEVLEPVTLTYGDLSYDLQKDWNLIGWGASGGEVTLVDEALDSIAGFYVMVWTFNAAAQEWQVYDTADGAPDDFGNLIAGQGYWIEVSDDCVLVYGIHIYYLQKGWNQIGWLG